MGEILKAIGQGVIIVINTCVALTMYLALF